MDTFGSEEIALLGQTASDLRKAGLVRHLEEPALLGGFRLGHRIIRYRSDRPPISFPLGYRTTPEAELSRREILEKAVPRITPGRARKAGWIQIPKSSWWVPSWHRDIVLREARTAHDRRWSATERDLKAVVGLLAFLDAPVLLIEHLVEARMFRPQWCRRESLRLGILDFFSREALQLPWAQDEERRLKLAAWWQQNETRIRQTRFPGYS